MDKTTHALEQGRSIRTISGLLRAPSPSGAASVTPRFPASPLEHFTERKATSKIDVNDGAVAEEDGFDT